MPTLCVHVSYFLTPGDNYSRVFLCKQHLVFDFLGYWWHKQGDPDGACPQPSLSDLEYT